MIIEELSPRFYRPGNIDAGQPAIADRLFTSISDLPFPFLLESCDSPANDAARFTFLGADPFMTIKAMAGQLEVLSGGSRKIITGDPLQTVRETLKSFRADAHPVFPFCGGAVGYIGYETVEQIESLPSRKHDGISLPDLYLNLYDTIFIIDNFELKVYLASSGFPEKGSGKDKRAGERAAFFRQHVPGAADPSFDRPQIGRLACNFGKEEYIGAVKRVKDYIENGDIYQANLAQRFQATFSGSSYEIYRRFRELNPVPFGAFLKYPELEIISNSPERFLSLRNGIIETRPIKGTVSRSTSRAKDEELKSALRESPKERAEHIMIVDLERNDLGKVCKYGTIKVNRLYSVESYSNLHHLVSSVSGEMKEGVDATGCILAAFPGGSITGAPKVRAMEVIHEVEPNPRWLYTGSIGYLGFDGGMDMNIAIRTAFVANGSIYFSVGGGIVADSDPEAEYNETLLKGEIFMKIAKGSEEKR